MKVAVSAVNPEYDSPLQPRFGRCEYFVVIDTETDAWEAHPNPAVDAMGGAGSQAAQFLANLGVQSVISGNFGPNAFMALDAAEIRMYQASGGSVREAVGVLLEDRLTPVSGATGPSRHGG